MTQPGVPVTGTQIGLILCTVGMLIDIAILVLVLDMRKRRLAGKTLDYRARHAYDPSQMHTCTSWYGTVIRYRLLPPKRLYRSVNDANQLAYRIESMIALSIQKPSNFVVITRL